MNSFGLHRRSDEVRPAVVVCATGGTIAGSADGRGQLSPTLSLETMVASVPGLEQAAQLKLIQLRQVPSAELTLGDVIEMVNLFEEHERSATGFVVVQGTDTIEESAFAFDLLWDQPAPVVVTGAMRPIEAPGSDAAPNLISAVRVAGSPAARDSGVLAVLNHTIHAARFVSKVHATRPDAFQSPQRGPVGEVSEERVVIWADARREPSLPVPDPAAQAPVALRRITMGDDARCIANVAEIGYRGLVVEAMGTGHVPSGVVDELAALAASMPVVLSSRTGPGELFLNTYGFPGSESDLLARGLIPCTGLDGTKARVKLTLLIMAGASIDLIRRSFAPEPTTGDPTLHERRTFP